MFLALIAGFGVLLSGFQPAEITRKAERVAALSAPDTAQVLLSLTAQLGHPQARATIIRPVGEDVPEMIMVTPQTTAEDLQAALDMLLQARMSFGPTVEREMVAHVPAAAENASTSDEMEMRRANLALLQQGENLELPGFGTVKAVVIKVADINDGQAGGAGAAHAH